MKIHHIAVFLGSSRRKGNKNSENVKQNFA